MGLGFQKLKGIRVQRLEFWVVHRLRVVFGLFKDLASNNIPPAIGASGLSAAPRAVGFSMQLEKSRLWGLNLGII